MRKTKQNIQNFHENEEKDDVPFSVSLSLTPLLAVHPVGCDHRFWLLIVTRTFHCVGASRTFTSTLAADT